MHWHWSTGHTRQTGGKSSGGTTRQPFQKMPGVLNFQTDRAMRVNMVMVKAGKDKGRGTNGGKRQERRQHNEAELFFRRACHGKIVA